ncbi:MBL fold metallo-hydrolase [Salinifilum aidingensis]
MAPRIDHTTTSGVFSLDGQSFDVDNNAWVLGDERECVVIDVPHDAQAVRGLVGERTVRAVLCTHAHDDHVRAAPELADAVGAPLHLHPDDLVLWRMTHPDREPDRELADGQRLELAGSTIEVVHTPGHAPGAVCFSAPELGTVFTGDTLFAGGPGATGRSYSDFDVLIGSIRDRLLSLPGSTVVRPGHGENGTIGHARENIADWAARGW